MRAVVLPLAIALTLSLVPTSALGQVDAWGGGPVLAVTTDGDVALGWELTATAYLPLLHFVVGGSYRLGLDAPPPPKPDDYAPSRTRPPVPRLVHYLAFEPWIGLGGTFGVSVDDRPRVGFVAGVWEAAPVWWREEATDREWGDPVPYLMVTISIGVRDLAGAREIYISPKLQHVVLPDLFA